MRRVLALILAVVFLVDSFAWAFWPMQAPGVDYKNLWVSLRPGVWDTALVGSPELLYLPEGVYLYTYDLLLKVETARVLEEMALDLPEGQIRAVVSNDPVLIRIEDNSIHIGDVNLKVRVELWQDGKVVRLKDVESVLNDRMNRDGEWLGLKRMIAFFALCRFLEERGVFLERSEPIEGINDVVRDRMDLYLREVWANKVVGGVKPNLEYKNVGKKDPGKLDWKKGVLVFILSSLMFLFTSLKGISQATLTRSDLRVEVVQEENSADDPLSQEVMEVIDEALDEAYGWFVDSPYWWGSTKNLQEEVRKLDSIIEGLKWTAFYLGLETEWKPEYYWAILEKVRLTRRDDEGLLISYLIRYLKFRKALYLAVDNYASHWPKINAILSELEAEKVPLYYLGGLYRPYDLFFKIMNKMKEVFEYSPETDGTFAQSFDEIFSLLEETGVLDEETDTLQTYGVFSFLHQESQLRSFSLKLLEVREGKREVSFLSFSEMSLTLTRLSELMTLLRMDEDFISRINELEKKIDEEVGDLLLARAGEKELRLAFTQLAEDFVPILTKALAQVLETMEVILSEEDLQPEIRSYLSWKKTVLLGLLDMFRGDSFQGVFYQDSPSSETVSAQSKADEVVDEIGKIKSTRTVVEAKGEVKTTKRKYLWLLALPVLGWIFLKLKDRGRSPAKRERGSFSWRKVERDSIRKVLETPSAVEMSIPVENPQEVIRLLRESSSVEERLALLRFFNLIPQEEIVEFIRTSNEEISMTLYRRCLNELVRTYAGVSAKKSEAGGVGFGL